jgi:hypothetical protein
LSGLSLKNWSWQGATVQHLAMTKLPTTSMQTTTGHIALIDYNSPSYSMNSTSSEYCSSQRAMFLTQLSTAKDVNQVIKVLEEL